MPPVKFDPLSPMAINGSLGGRPHKWPWFETPINGTFVMAAKSVESVRSSLSRARRLHRVDFRIERRLGPARYLVRRVA